MAATAGPPDGRFEHLYDARGLVDDWLGHPTFWGMISEEALEAPVTEGGEPPGEGPILHWETRVVLGPGGDAWHPANRKVKVMVHVKELGLSTLARARLLALVGRRYNPARDALTIISERYAAREENRKDVLRILVALIDEARTADNANEDADANVIADNNAGADAATMTLAPA
eukprot:SM000345S12844  [mRNA]  locus=s345:86149:87326:- [translate_table: standard]